MVSLAVLLLVAGILASSELVQGAARPDQAEAGSALRSQLKEQQLAAMKQSVATAASLKLPSRFGDILSTTPGMAARARPQTLASKYQGTPPSSKLVKLHWAIISCDRHMWGRMMTHSLLSGLFNELRPTTISIVWCKPFQEGGYPPLLHDLRHSHSVNVFFPNEEIMKQTSPDAINGLKEGSWLTSTQLRRTDPTYLTALMVPLMLGRPDLPLVLSEDDAVFAPDANARLATVLGQIEHTVKDDPFLIQLYDHNRRTEAAPDKPEGLGQPSDDDTRTRMAHDSQSVTVHHRLTWGTQGYFLSPGMNMLLLNYWLNMTQPGALHKNWGQDYHIVFFLRETLKCNSPGSQCWFYQMNPAMLQHIGTSSSLFNNAGKQLNQKWHMSRSFPVQVAMPGYENKWSWRRLARRFGM